MVAPFAGAWIEIANNNLYNGGSIVAPFAGAWIEIQNSEGLTDHVGVAPFAGAWIEIKGGGKSFAVKECRSLRGSVD